jgi:hypothetical protein
MTEREPRGWQEHVVANCRPQPAIPAVLAFFVLVLIPLMPAAAPAAEISTWQLWLIPAGLAISCGLAIAAGFCSVAPPLIWIVFATWGLSLAERAGLPVVHMAIIYLGIAVAVIMVFVQIWRIRTRRFVPTVVDAEELR